MELGLLSGVAACPMGQKISHPFFFFFLCADDSPIFCKATIEKCSTLEEVLEIYESSSGQQLNHEKTSQFFSQNMS